MPGLDSWSRSQGWAAPHWAYQNGTVTHYPGHNEDYLIFRTPLRGDFEVTCELRVQGWAEAHVRYGSHQFDLNHDWKQYRMHTSVQHNGRHVTISPPLPATKDNVYRFKLVIKDGWFRAFVEDRELAVERRTLHSPSRRNRRQPGTTDTGRDDDRRRVSQPAAH